MKENLIYIIGTAILGAVISFLIEPIKEYIQSPLAYSVIVSLIIVGGFKIIEKNCVFNKKYVLILVYYSTIISLIFQLVIMWLMSGQLDTTKIQIDIAKKQNEKIKNLETELDTIKKSLDTK